MTFTIDGMTINKEYRVALVWDKFGGYYARLYQTTKEMHPQLNVPIINTTENNHYGCIDEKIARRRFWSQVARWKKSI
jgi:hypothetical protein